MKIRLDLSPKGEKVCSASGRRSSNRVPMEDLGNNKHPSPCMSKKATWCGLEGSLL